MIKLLLGIVAGLCVPLAAYADTYTFSCPESASIKGAIHYSVIGTYRSIFRDCSGKIVYDDQRQQPKLVDLEIKAASIKSNCPWCDSVVRSHRVFHTAVYPYITFKSRSFEHKDGCWWVSGQFDIHGVTKKLFCRFQLEKQKDALLLKGVWKFNRKDFNIIWNKWLDHGGIMVGDDVTVDWQARARKI